MFEEFKTLSMMESRAGCPECGQAAPRTISGWRGEVSCANMEPHYNHAFGEVVTNRRELNECVRRYRGETGVDLVEVGNDKSERKWKRKEYGTPWR